VSRIARGLPPPSPSILFFPIQYLPILWQAQIYVSHTLI
jgi:hypothetical protein